MPTFPKVCSHGVPLADKFCRGCSLVWCREQLKFAERNVERFKAEIIELEKSAV